MWGRIQQKYRHSQKCITSQIRISPPNQKREKRCTMYVYIYIYIKRAAIFILLIQITTKHRKLKRLPSTCHCHHGESTSTIRRAPHPQKSHHQISTADLPANTQSNFIIMFNTQYIKYHI
jgi:hypothetical protein